MKLGGKPKSHVGKPCPYCGVAMTKPRGLVKYGTSATRDHIKPKSGGGNNLPRNRIIVCQRCNIDKGDRFLSTWLYELQMEDDPRVPFVERVLVFLREQNAVQPGNHWTRAQI